MTQTRWLLTPSYKGHFHIFKKLDSFLKPVLNIFILCNLIADWREVVIKEGAGNLHQIYRFRGVNSWWE